MNKDDTTRQQDRWIYIGFLLLIAWVPLPLGSNRAWAWSVMEAWVFILAIAWIVAWLRHRTGFNPVFFSARPVLYLFLFWLLWIVIQIIPMPAAWVQVLSPQAYAIYATSPTAPHDWLTLSLDTYSTQQALLKSVAYVLIFCLALLLLHTRDRVRQCALLLIFCGVFQAVYGSLMALSGMEYGFIIKKTTSLGYASGTFTNRNHLAGYLEMSLAIGIGMMIASLGGSTHYNSWRQRLRDYMRLMFTPKVRIRLSLVIMVIALVLTHSRMGNTAFFSSMLIAGTIGLLLSRHATRGTVILLVSLIIIDILIVGTWFGIEEVAERLEQTTLATENRDEVFSYILALCNDFQWTGSGLGTFYAVFPAYRHEDVAGYYNHAHNDYLEFAAETGIIGLMILGSIVIWSLVIALLAQYKRQDPLMRGMSFAAIMGIVAILIHSSVDFNLQIPANAVVFMLLLSMAWIALTLGNQHRHHHHHRHHHRHHHSN